MPQDPYASIAKPIDDPYASIAKPIAATPQQQGFIGSALDSSGLSTLGHALAHPVDAVQAIPSALSGIVHNTTDNVKQGIQDYQKTGLSEQTRRDFGRAVPFVGPTLATAQAQHDAGNNAGMAGTLAGFVGGMVAPEGIAKGLQALPGAAKVALAGDVTKPIGLTGVSPLDRFQSAKALGANLDAASATNSTPLKVIKKLNENSLLGSPTYEATKAGNIAAVHSGLNNLLDEAYQGDAESGGAAIQKALKDNQQALHAAATAGFQSLPKDYVLPGSLDLGSAAKNIAQQQEGYYSQFPSLRPSKALNVLDDVSGLAPKPKLPEGVQGPELKPTSPADFGTIQRLRSDLLDFNRNNQDVVKNQSGGWVQQLAGKADNTMTDAATGLPPAQQQVFRDANAKWNEMKRYDDTSDPLHWALNSKSPSKLAAGDGLGPKTPETVRDIAPRLGDSIGALQRGTIESALKPTSDGVPNYMNFPLQLNRIPEAYRNELLNAEQKQGLGHINNTIQALGKDFNPSGSGKLLQNVAEGSAITAGVTGHPLAAAWPLAQYPIAKLMNSPAVVDWLMNQGGTPSQLPSFLKAGRGLPLAGKPKDSQ